MNKKLHCSLLVFSIAMMSTSWAQDNLPPVQRTQFGAPKCPEDNDIRNIDVRLSARVVPPKNQAALQVERAKAITCRRSGGEYTPRDWDRMRAVTSGDN